MQCSAFYAQTKAILAPTGFTYDARGCLPNVYFGAANDVVFHDHWDASNISSLKLLQDISNWENSSDYIEAHYYINANGCKCVSLSATSDVAYANDVTNLKIENNMIKIEGDAR